MKNNKFLPSLLIICLVLLSNEVYAVQDSILPITAKGAWYPTRGLLKWELGYNIHPTLFKAYPEKEIDPKDTVLCSDTIYIPDDLTSRYWNGKAYKWVFECRVPELSKDSIFKVTTYFKQQTPPFIFIETIYNPITEYVDTVGIAEGTWFDSDSIYKNPDVNRFGLYRIISLERGLSEKYIPDTYKVRTMWNMNSVGNNGVFDKWLSVDARTGEILREGVVSVSEPDNHEMNSAGVMPNPTNNSISIQTDNEFRSVNLYSMMGQKLDEWTAVQPHQKLSVAHLPEGMYMIQYVDCGTLRSIPLVIAR